MEGVTVHVEQRLGDALRARDAHIARLTRVPGPGPPDLVWLQRESWAPPPTATGDPYAASSSRGPSEDPPVGLYFWSIGDLHASPADVAATFMKMIQAQNRAATSGVTGLVTNTLSTVAKLATGSAPTPPPHPYHFTYGCYCLYDAFSRSDIRVTMRIPGGVASHAVGPLGPDDMDTETDTDTETDSETDTEMGTRDEMNPADDGGDPYRNTSPSSSSRSGSGTGTAPPKTKSKVSTSGSRRLGPRTRRRRRATLDVGRGVATDAMWEGAVVSSWVRAHVYDPVAVAEVDPAIHVAPEAPFKNPKQEREVLYGALRSLARTGVLLDSTLLLAPAWDVHQVGGTYIYTGTYGTVLYCTVLYCTVLYLSPVPCDDVMMITTSKSKRSRDQHPHPHPRTPEPYQYIKLNPYPNPNRLTPVYLPPLREHAP